MTAELESAMPNLAVAAVQELDPTGEQTCAIRLRINAACVDGSIPLTLVALADEIGHGLRQVEAQYRMAVLAGLVALMHTEVRESLG